MNVLYQYAFQEIPMPVLDSSGVEIDAALFAEAEYRVKESGTCTDVYSASLGSGIAVVSGTLVLTIPENDLTVTGTNGEYEHYLRVAYNPGELGPPVFDQKVDIIPGCQIP